ncbi:hypothetical protein GCM10009584_08040 [Ornithinimicrobium humiphilum]|uniref:Zinc carboxypeptidase n=1 Tax=Ornithinimicrobium humiphilum TaxID=125288 RepID=A0A543KQG6_9MICO|nr:M14 family zinc carboxypeptidase [Ornithinimicrobium humiphilum]TQM97316.1 zinc carboxypeptidase [Ornithinimicrobium humiphilum]
MSFASVAPSPARKRMALTLAAVLAASGLATLSMPAQSEARPLEASCGNLPGKKVNESFLTSAEVVDSLRKIEKNSKGRLDLDVAGYTNNGKPIHTARVGEGDTVVFIESQIHGNEPHGTVALLEVLKTLTNDSKRSAEIRKAVTVVALPQLNGDGADLQQRQNSMTWADVVEDFPQLAGAPRAWNFNTANGGFDVNRDFHPDLDFVPQASDFPGNSASTGWYITPEARTSRDVYKALEQEFGTVDIFVDLHNQGPCYTDDALEDYSTLSISARFIADPTQFGDWPKFDYDASRRVNVAVYDALQGNNSPQSKVTLYPQNTNLPGTALGAFALRGSATILFETIGMTQTTAQKMNGQLAKQVETGLTAILDSVTDGTLDDIDPERYELIPERRNVPRN